MTVRLKTLLTSHLLCHGKPIASVDQIRIFLAQYLLSFGSTKVEDLCGLKENRKDSAANIDCC